MEFSSKPIANEWSKKFTKWTDKFVAAVHVFKSRLRKLFRVHILYVRSLTSVCQFYKIYTSASLLAAGIFTPVSYSFTHDPLCYPPRTTAPFPHHPWDSLTRSSPAPSRQKFWLQTSLSHPLDQFTFSSQFAFCFAVKKDARLLVAFE